MISHNTITDVLTKKGLYRMKRDVLNDIALRLGVFDFATFNTKKELVNRIKLVRERASARCYNKTDPCTLEDIDSIQLTHLIEWNQYGKHFGCKICSLKSMFDANQTILPWSIDFASGVDKCANVDDYNMRFDMRNVQGLEEVVREHPCGNMCGSDKGSPPDHHTPHFFLFEMDALLNGCDYSYGHTINYLVRNQNVHFIYVYVCEAMYRMYVTLYEQGHVYGDIFHQFVYIHYSMQGCHVEDHVEHLRFLVDVFKGFRDIIGDANASAILSVMFLDMQHTL
tara:strand:- start:2104 stop:2949 length:846 start_codon:yes stop_codon:yes gene_type:complete